MSLTFLNAAFLFGALASLLPLIIHLLSRRRAETVEFSSLRFLRELERRQIRRVRIRQILLLVVRSLIILTVALALARPTLSGPTAFGGGHARTSVAIILDQSASMSREGSSGTLFDEAVRLALGASDLLAEGDQAFLVTAGSPPASLLSGGTFSRGALVDAVGEVEVSSAATDYVGAVDIALDRLSTARNLNRELYVVGDLQRSGWSGPNTRQVESPASSAIGPDRRPTAYLFALEGPVGNQGVRSVAVQRRYGVSGGAYSVAAEIGNDSRRQVDVPVRLYVDGVQVGHSGVDLGPGERGGVQFSVMVDETAWHSGRVELPSDVFVADDSRYFVIPPVRTTEVLVVGPDGDERSGDAFYIYRALDPTGHAERFRPSIVAASSLSAQEEGRFPAVVLADVGRLDEAGVRWLERHVAAGGGLFVVLGDRTDVRAWNEGELPGSNVVNLIEPFERESGLRLAPSGQGHPMLEGLVVGERLVDEIDVRRGFVAERGGAEEVLEFPGVGPALLIVRGPESGAGEVAVLLTAVDARWSDLPRSGFLVPLVHRVVEQISGGSASLGEALVGGDLAVGSRGIAGRIDVVLPDETVVTAEQAPGGRGAVVFRNAMLPGIYSFVMGGQTLALGAVNVDPVESELAPAGSEEIKQSLAGLDCRFVDAAGDVAGQILEARRGRELWRVFVYAALALLALEMYLSRQRAS